MTDKPKGKLRMNRYDGDLHQPNETSFIGSHDSLDEATSSQQDYALKVGLASDLNKLSYYRRVMTDPRSLVSNPILRPYAAEMLKKLLDLVLNDATIWNRAKGLLMKNKGSVRGLKERVSDSGLRSLIGKATKHSVPLEVVLEVYSRGAETGGECGGFDRVNSFLAGGKARTMDADLLGESAEPEPKEKNRTLSTVKRVLREKKQ